MMTCPILFNQWLRWREKLKDGRKKKWEKRTTSSTALCMLFHALQAAVIEETGYQAEQFALIHPGGAVGERLNKKALDIV